MRLLAGLSPRRLIGRALWWFIAPTVCDRGDELRAQRARILGVNHARQRF